MSFSNYWLLIQWALPPQWVFINIFSQLLQLKIPRKIASIPNKYLFLIHVIIL